MADTVHVALMTEIVKGSKVYVGTTPTFFDMPSVFRELGIKGVINLQDEYAGPVEEYKRLNIDQLYLPTVDHYEPTYEDLKRSVSFIEKHTGRGGGVYIHCKSGVGRSAAVAFCWLLKEVSS